MVTGLSLAVKRARNGLILTFRQDDFEQGVEDNQPHIAANYQKARDMIESFLDAHLKDAPKAAEKKK